MMEPVQNKWESVSTVYKTTQHKIHEYASLALLVSEMNNTCNKTIQENQVLIEK